LSELAQLVDACLCPAYDEWVLEADGIRAVSLYGRHAAELEPIGRELRGRGLLVATDEEGGDVTRLHYRDGSPVPGNLALGVVDDVELTRRVSGAIAGELASVGVNWNLAPVADVNSEPNNPVIGVRAFGSDPELVARHARAFVEGTQAQGVAACAKHFPGHGATRADSHHELPVSLSHDLAPFAAAVDAGVRSVMTAHVVYPELDEVPATLSPRVLGLLRSELGFDGVIVTDALEMRAVSERWGVPGAAVRALAAGADLLLLGEHDAERDRAAICAAVGVAVSPARLEEAAERVRRLADWASSPRISDEPPNRVGLEAARRALRVEGALPIAKPPFVVELRAQTNPAVGEAHWSLADALAELGFLAGAVSITHERAGDRLPAVDAQLVVACRDAFRIPWQRGWLERAQPDVVVALGLADDRRLAPHAFVAAQGAGRANTLAAAHALRGW
jgi:beta-N-acetylhexosaminidase